MRYLLLALLITHSAFAVEWLCTEEASQRKGNSIWACGVGTAAHLDDARKAAFKSAKAEFDRVCLSSDDCRGRKVSVEPRRTECSTEEGVTCHRLVVFTIKPTEADRETRAREDDEYLHQGMTNKEVVDFMGVPDVAEKWSDELAVFIYRDNKKCSVPDCQLFFDRHTRRLVRHSGVKPLFTDALH